MDGSEDVSGIVEARSRHWVRIVGSMRNAKHVETRARSTSAWAAIQITPPAYQDGASQSRALEMFALFALLARVKVFALLAVGMGVCLSITQEQLDLPS